jgi:hypothetical protein
MIDFALPILLQVCLVGDVTTATTCFDVAEFDVIQETGQRVDSPLTSYRDQPSRLVVGQREVLDAGAVFVPVFTVRALGRGFDPWLYRVTVVYDEDLVQADDFEDVAAVHSVRGSLKW